MKKNKPLLPSLKEKKRYLVYETVSARPLPHQDIMTAITTTLHTFLGTLTMAKAGIQHLSTTTQNTGIIRVSAKYADHVRAALCTVRNINKTEAMVRSVGLSGTLHKARLKFLEQKSGG